VTQSVTQFGPVEDCLFCKIAAGELAAHIVLDEPDVVAFLDARPVFKGHVLVIPRQHHETLFDLPTEMLTPLFGATQRVGAAIEEALAADGVFVGINNTVSQSVPHLHVHAVPRRRKDGLRGFFWPRQRYADDGETTDFAERLRASVRPL
jgi:histidine triad (HIT) family protein